MMTFQKTTEVHHAIVWMINNVVLDEAGRDWSVVYDLQTIQANQQIQGQIYEYVRAKFLPEVII